MTRSRAAAALRLSHVRRHRPRLRSRTRAALTIFVKTRKFGAMVLSAALAVGALAVPAGAQEQATGFHPELWSALYSSLPSGDGFDQATGEAISPDGSTVYSTGLTDTINAPGGHVAYAVVARDAATGKQKWAGTYYNTKCPTGFNMAIAITVSPNGSAVYVTGDGINQDCNGTNTDPVTVAFNAATGARLWVARYHNASFGDQQSGAGLAIAVSPNGSTVYVTGPEEPTGSFKDPHDQVTVAYSAADGAQQWAALYPVGAGFPIQYDSLAVSPDGSAVYVSGVQEFPSGGGNGDYVMVAYDAATGARKWVTSSPGFTQQDMALSPDGSRIYITGTPGGSTADAQMTVAYDAATGTQDWAVKAPGYPSPTTVTDAVAVNPNGSAVYVTGSAGTLAYGATTGKQEWVTRIGSWDFPGFFDALGGIAVSPDGSTVYATGITGGNDGDYNPGLENLETAAYNADTGAAKWRSAYDTGYDQFNLAPDGNHSLVVSPDGSRVFITGFVEGGSCPSSQQSAAAPRVFTPQSASPKALPVPKAVPAAPGRRPGHVTRARAAGSGTAVSAAGSLPCLPYGFETVAYDAATGGQPSDCTVPGRLLVEGWQHNGFWGQTAATIPVGTDLHYLRLAQVMAGGSEALRFQVGTDPASLTPPSPGTFWEVSLHAPDGQVHGVRMVFLSKSPTTPVFESYIAAPDPSGPTAGQVTGRTVLPGSEKKAIKGSSYDPATGTIVINAPIGDLGLKPGDTITGFNAAVMEQGTAVQSTMPPDLNGSVPSLSSSQFTAFWPYTIYPGARCPG